MATAITANPQPLATISNSRQNHLSRPPPPFPSFAADEEDAGPHSNPHMSFSMRAESQGGNYMSQPGTYRPYDGTNGNGHGPRHVTPQIYSAIYSGVDVYEMEVNGIAVMRRRKDSWLNATQILKVAGIEKGKRTKVLEKEILIGEHEKVQGGYGKYQGTWIKFERGLEFCRQYGVEELLRPLLTYDMGQDGGVAGSGGIDTPTKEQAMAAQRKRLYNSAADSRGSGHSGTFFKNISSTASHAVAAISKARFDSPGPRIRNGSARPASFSRQSSQQHIGSQEAFPGGSQQSIQSYASADSFTVNGHQSAYGTHYSHTSQDDLRNGDFEEPPRKRIRSTPKNDDLPLTNGYYDMSLREGSPTEPNESFVYRPQQTMSQEEALGPLQPLKMAQPEDERRQAKKSIIMSLFTDPNRADFSQHEAIVSLSPQDLDMPIDSTAHTALHWAATLARIPLLKALLASGASIYRVNRAGETALMRACVVTNNLDQGSFPDLLELLGPTIGLCDLRGRTVLHHIAVTSAVKGRSQASKYYLECLLEFIVRQGTPSNSQQSFNGLPVPRAMGIGRFMSEVVNVQDKSGDTALNIAARIGNRSIISQLLEVNADPQLANRSNLCPIDFGVGNAEDIESRVTGTYGSPTKALISRDPKESSGNIISSITNLLSEVEIEFTKEMESKQAHIDSLHHTLRDSSAALGEQRRCLESLQAAAKQREQRKIKINNLLRAADEERARLAQLQAQFGPPINNGDAELKLGDADKGLAVSLSSQRDLPPAHVLRARLNAYKKNNEVLEERVKGLKRESTELAGKYRRIVSLCTRVEEGRVDAVLEGLLRAVESEGSDVEIGRVRGFLARVEGPE